jgi:hypothetical protein
MLFTTSSPLSRNGVFLVERKYLYSRIDADVQEPPLCEIPPYADPKPNEAEIRVKKGVHKYTVFLVQRNPMA